MDKAIFSPMEIDAIGEIMNISLGSSATAVSNMLEHRVDITTPTVSVVQAEDFVLGELEPAVALVIKYVCGLEGANIMLLKRSDIKVIVDILMGSETSDEEFELNELTISAVCEVMNQMMGAASTALSDFLDRMVNISTPESFELDDLRAFKEEHFPVKSGPVVAVRFMLSIEDALKSEFINIMSVELARDLVAGFGISEYTDDEEEQATAQPEPSMMNQVDMSPAAAPAAEQQPYGQQPPYPGQEAAEQQSYGQQPPYPGQAPAEQQPYGQQPPYPGQVAAEQQPYGQQPSYPGQVAMQPPYGQPPLYQQPYGQPPMAGMPPYQPPVQQPAYGVPPVGTYPAQGVYPPPTYGSIPKIIATQSPQMENLDAIQTLGEDQAQNLELIMSVPLEVSVEIGRTRRKVQEILAYTKGSLVVLDKLAGDQVDLFVNGKCIAKGDVVVIDDNFGIRITEILQRSALDDLAVESLKRG